MPGSHHDLSIGLSDFLFEDVHVRASFVIWISCGHYPKAEKSEGIQREIMDIGSISPCHIPPGYRPLTGRGRPGGVIYPFGGNRIDGHCHITRCVDSRDIRFHALIHQDATLEINPGVGEEFRVRSHADSLNKTLCGKGAAILHTHPRHPFPLVQDFGHLDIGLNPYTVFTDPVRD